MLKKIIAIGLILFLALFCMSITSFSEDKEYYIIGDHYTGCVSKKRCKRLAKYAVDNDFEMFNVVLLNGFMSGQCTKFKKGEPVYCEDVLFFSLRAESVTTIVQLRRPGETKKYWTMSDAIFEDGR